MTSAGHSPNLKISEFMVSYLLISNLDPFIFFTGMFLAMAISSILKDFADGDLRSAVKSNRTRNEIGLISIENYHYLSYKND
ncbi:hypothetical protein EHR01_17085 [Leptospira mtsangambouensis]|uniref:Uncharacterized protein n=1 Tax=Leptospira mtsangambouensis TaxID=2484912 RepID=A0ABY2NWW2_9LEPT|nr:hypothetical protein [Leptospira mtsangambouensis]TGM72936.1 hypothetical protein EHR01_17085 [Leptospira mtsangambouensis]